MAKKKNAPKPKQTLYSWNGGPKTHNISQGQHEQNVQARGYGIDLNAPASQPLSSQAAFALANATAGQQYDPQIQAAKQIGASVDPWVRNYIAETTARQQAAQAYAAPMVQQAQTWADQAPTAAPGLDPNSVAGQQSTQAATSGQGLARLGYATLAAIPVATNGYLAGQADMARQQVPGAQAYYAQQAANLQGQKAGQTASNYGTIRQNEQNASIAYGTLGVNQQNALSNAGYDPVTGKQLPAKPSSKYEPGGSGLNKYGYSYDEWTKLSDADKNDARTGASGKAAKQAEKDAAAAKKKQAAIQKAHGTVTNKVTNIIEKWTGPATVNEPVTTTDPTTGQKTTVNKPRPATKAEHRQAIIDQYGFLGRIAIAVQEGRPLDAKAQAYLHNLDPNFRIPREWLVGKPQTTAQQNNPHGTAQTPDRAPGGTGHI